MKDARIDQRYQGEVRSAALARRSRMPASISSALQEAPQVGVAACATTTVIDSAKLAEPRRHLRHLWRRQLGQLLDLGELLAEARAGLGTPAGIVVVTTEMAVLERRILMTRGSYSVCPKPCRS